jgi:hypothetical protein
VVKKVKKITPICSDCQYYHYGQGTIACDAFPNGIPQKIWIGEIDHRNPASGDSGICYKSIITKNIDPTSLKLFVDDNERLLTVIGIFGGLAAFFSSLNFFLLYAILVMFLLLCYELQGQFSRIKEKSYNLDIFERTFDGFIFLFLIYLYREASTQGTIYKWGFVLSFFFCPVIYGLGLFEQTGRLTNYFLNKFNIGNFHYKTTVILSKIIIIELGLFWMFLWVWLMK